MEISLIQIVMVLLVCGLAWWIFQTYVLPHIPSPFNVFLIVVLAIAACFWLLSLVGLLGPIKIR